MRKTIFIFFIVLGAAIGFLSAFKQSIGVQIVMIAVGAVAGVAIGGALSRIGPRRRAKHVAPMASPETTEDRVSNYWLDHGRLTAAPGLPDPDATDQISLKP